MSRISTKKLNAIDSKRHLLKDPAPFIVGELVCEIRNLTGYGLVETDIFNKGVKEGWSKALDGFEKWLKLEPNEDGHGGMVVEWINEQRRNLGIPIPPKDGEPDHE